ncbi:MAG: HAMP domain-containing protein [Phycisphaerae bacterium]|nr:HAMP domain-containing protein [Phycisphaerae bacterium]
MAKKFVKISLATKFRVLFGAAVVGIIAVALLVPWYFMELLAERGVEQTAGELTRLRYNEYVQDHLDHGSEAAADDAKSEVVDLYARDIDGSIATGLHFVRLVPGKRESSLDAAGRSARQAFKQAPEQDLAVFTSEDERGRAVYRCFRAVRIDQSCAKCHRSQQRPELPARPGQLVGMVGVTMPESAAASGLVWWTRGAFVAGAGLAALLAFFLFVIISERLVLRPVRDLRGVSDRVAEGDLSVRSELRTGDELERLGESVNEMLQAISDQHNKLRAANRALDLKLNELAEANVTLYQANQVKSEFLTNVSHELRTPLNSIIGFAELLAEREDERVARYGRNIGEAAKSLLRMINDLLDLAKIEAGKADVRLDKVSVTDTCQTLVTLMHPQADKRSITLELSLASDVPVIRTDPAKLQQILYNLLSNAVKFTPAGGKVIVSASGEPSQGHSDESGGVVVAVRDTGPGLSEAEQQHIFDKFYQADRTLTKESQGTGLGLAIVRELTQLLGGRLEVNSAPGHGATFAIHLPPDGPELTPEAGPDAS